MAANPPLVVGPGPAGTQQTFPLPYHGEIILLSRGGVGLELRGPSLRTRGGKWAAKGTVFISSLRVVLIADKPDASGLQAFELPLAYVSEEAFAQPIFGANRLTGRCCMVDSGPGGDTVQFSIYFREGGVGTFVPLFYRTCAYVRSMASQMQQQAQQAQQQAQQPAPGYPAPASAAEPQQFLATALVDPSDPTKLYLTQPLDASQQRPDSPKFPAPLV